jgi:tetratricopeptide (TPR) repeat protein/SAM-dependent methyltransferase
MKPPSGSGLPGRDITSDLLGQAIGLHQAGRFADAEQLYNRILSIDKKNFDALHLLGTINAQHGNFSKAQQLLSDALKIKPRSVEVLINLGNVLRLQGRASEAVTNYTKAISVDPNSVLALSNCASALSALGQLDEARTTFDRALKIKPDYFDALYNRGNLLVKLDLPAEALIDLNKAQAIQPHHPATYLARGNALMKLERIEEAIQCFDKALMIQQEFAEAWVSRGAALKEQKRLGEALASFDRALKARPQYAEAFFNRAVTLHELRRLDEAVASYERSMALQPDLVEAANGLAKIYIAQGKIVQALAVSMQALRVKETHESRSLVIDCMKNVGIDDDPWNLRFIALRALSESWAWPRDFAGTVAQLIKLSPIIREGCARAMSAWPARLPERKLLGPSGLAAITDDQLLLSLLQSTAVCDVELERLLTCLRHILLGAAEGSALRSDTATTKAIPFYCALAMQCFINEYVFDVTAEESHRVQQLRDRLISAQSVDSVPMLWILAVATYFPLHSLAVADALLENSWPAAVARLLTLQVREPREEIGYRDSIPRITSIGDDVSLLVKQQYEENPYPRWIKAPLPKKSKSSGERFQWPERSSAKEILVAGCGTGLAMMDALRRYPEAQVLALDLSLASLCYAKRKAHVEGLTNIEFAQADILNLAAFGRTFDIVHATGVLHHLSDPWQGWRILLSLLRPGGSMIVGLYSKQARRDITAARNFVSERGYLAIDDDIRRCRQEIMSLADHPAIRNVAKIPDFFSTSECRDLLFHVQEHQFTLPEITKFLAENNVEFCGFDNSLSIEKFKLRFPQAAATDLDLWHVFETENPYIFLEMYHFQVKKDSTRGDSGDVRNG